MNLPPRALQVLVNIKAELLVSAPPIEAPPEPIVEMLVGIRAELDRKTPERQMRHARTRHPGYQKMCRRRGQ